jgi:hypothetical protein
VGVPTLTVAFLLSVAPILLRLLPDPGWAPEDVSLLGLALLPWIALAGLPRAGETAPRAAAVGLALPALALGWAMDARGRGELGLDGLWTLAAGVLLIATLERACAGARRHLYGGVWLALVPGVALLGALGEGGWSELAGSLSPLTWSFARAGVPVETGLAALPFGPLAAALALWALAGRRGEASS